MKNAFDGCQNVEEMDKVLTFLNHKTDVEYYIRKIMYSKRRSLVERIFDEMVISSKKLHRHSC